MNLLARAEHPVHDAPETIETEAWLPRPVSEIFSFFCEPRNLERLTPPFLHFQVLGSSTEKMGAGTLIDYRLRVHGVPFAWRTRIERWEPNRMFVDRQMWGPYALWHHTHDFLPDGAGTLMRDRVCYRLPFGSLGRLVAGPLVGRDVEAIFSYRRQVMRSLFAADRGDES